MKKFRRQLFKVLKYGVLLFWTFIVLFPIYWMISTSFKTASEWFTWPVHWIPHDFTLTNWISVLLPPKWKAGLLATAEAGYQTFKLPLRSLVHSIIVAGSASLICVLVSFFGAYSISRFKTGGKGFLYHILAFRMLLPIVIAFPFLVYYSTIGFLDTFWGLILIYIGTTIPYGIFMLKGFLDEIPVELEQAAWVMGAGRLYSLRKIVFPLVISGIIVTFLFILIINWSEFLFALTMTYSDVSTLPVQLNRYEGASEGRLYGPQAAFGMIATIPLVIIGYAIQRHLVTGFSFGMLRKG